MLAYLSLDEIKDFRVFTPTLNLTTQRYVWTDRKISEVVTPMAPGFLNLKRLFKIKEIKYRLKWKRQTLPSFAFTTGLHEASASGDDFEVVNTNFLQFLGAHAAEAVSLPNGDLPAAPEKITKASLIAGLFALVDILILFKDNSDFMTVWPLTNFTETDVRRSSNYIAANGNASMTDQPVFSGVRHGANSGANAFRALFVKGEFLGPVPNTDLTAETSNPALYSAFDGTSHYDMDVTGNLIVYYREFWQFIYEP